MAAALAAGQVGFTALEHALTRALETRLQPALQRIAVRNVDDGLVVPLALLAGDPGIPAGIFAAGCILCIGKAWNQNQERES